MTYYEGFIVPVPEGNKDAYRKSAADFAPIFREFGATRHVEAWDSDVPEGKVTDFRMAVNAEPGEKVVFSWFEYPDKATRDAANQKMRSDPRMQEATMPFDGKRMIMGGFEPIVEDGSERGGYIDGFVLPVAEDKLEAYKAMAQKAAPIFREYGALRDIETVASDVPARRGHRFLPRGQSQGRREGRLLLRRVAGQGDPRRRLEEDHGRRADEARP